MLIIAALLSYIAIFALLAALALYDYRHYILPDKLNATLALAFIVFHISTEWTLLTPLSTFLGAATGGGILLLIRAVANRYYNRPVEKLKNDISSPLPLCGRGESSEAAEGEGAMRIDHFSTHDTLTPTLSRRAGEGADQQSDFPDPPYQDSLGLGDVKLMAAAGLGLGFPNIMLALTLGALLGLCHGVVMGLIIRRKGEKNIPFGQINVPAGLGFSFGIAIVIAMQFKFDWM